MLKAWKLIDSPSKWYNGNRSAKGRYCLVTAILYAYGFSGGAVLKALRRDLHVTMLSRWNDERQWREVYEMLKERDI